MGSSERADRLLAAVKASPTHPLFYPRLFALLCREKSRERKKESDPIRRLLSEEYDDLSRRLERSQIQEGCSVRNILKTRQLAQLLIDEAGEVDLKGVARAIHFFTSSLYSVGPHRQYDSKRNAHIAQVLTLLLQRPDLVRLLKQVSRPLNSPYSEELIRQTLSLPPSLSVTDVHARRAVLAAWLCTLRQNVGSCFATAPAVMIHEEQPEAFLRDLIDLLATGMLKRTFGGIENTVPLSRSWGNGDLKKPLVIRFALGRVTPEIWYAPGLLQALEAAELIDPKEGIKQKVLSLLNAITPLLPTAESPLRLLTAEDIIRALLFQHLNVNEQQLNEYERRPRTLAHPSMRGLGTQGNETAGHLATRCMRFYSLFHKAKQAFKMLADNALLKAWEFTLASFSDIKYEFARWNFYASLGLRPEEAGGIGQCIHGILQQALDEANEVAQTLHAECEMVYTQVKTVESRLRRPSGDQEGQWLRMDYRNRLHEFQALQERLDEAQHRAHTLVTLYETLHRLYVELFQHYFQEIYDAEIQEITTGPFDDSPAGFRLLYKHGRSNPSQWTLIHTSEEFIESLAAFFVATESEIAHAIGDPSIEKDLSKVVTAIIHHVRTREFLESALHRMALVHRTPLIENPLDHLNQVEKKPWVYTSGGTMHTLISCYYRLEMPPREIEKRVESAMELLVYLADTLKLIPSPLLSPYLSGTRHHMLMQSPTHAFLLKPMANPFRETWSNDAFTYTFIRDRFVNPVQHWLEHLFLDEGMLATLVQQLSTKVPDPHLPRFQAICRQLRGPLTPISFRETLLALFSEERKGRSAIDPDDIDALLFTSLPLFPAYELRNRLEQLLFSLPSLTFQQKEATLQLFDRTAMPSIHLSHLDAQHLQSVCKALVALQQGATALPFDLHLEVSQAAQRLALSCPAPLIFADTNWVKEHFGFLVNPGTGRLDLWRLDETGSHGYPMSSWHCWLDGSHPEARWSVYVQPFQYGQS